MCDIQVVHMNDHGGDGADDDSGPSLIQHYTGALAGPLLQYTVL